MNRKDTVLERAIIFGAIKAKEDDPKPAPTPEEELATAKEQAASAVAEAKAAKDALENQKITVKVDGEDQTMTFEEARTALSKVGGADKKFQEASTLKKQAERGMRIDSLFAQLNNTETPDPAAVSELAGLFGVDPTALANFSAEEEKEPPKKITLDDLDPILKQQLEFDSQRNIEAAEQKILDEVRKRVDKDEIIGRMNSVAEEAGNKDFLATAAEEVHKDVLRKIRDNEPFGTEMIASSIQAARARFKRFGIPEKVSKPKTIIMGLGQPGGEPVSIQPDEPVERVDSSESDYSDNFVKRAFQMFAKGSVSKA